MIMVLGCWVMAMVAALSWARRYTLPAILLTVGVSVWQHTVLLHEWIGWAQLAALAGTPWLLVSQRQAHERELRALHHEEAVGMAQLAESARGLLSLQQAAKAVEQQITEITDLYHVTKATSGALHMRELFIATLTLSPRLLTAQSLRLIDGSGTTPQVFRAVRSDEGRLVPTGEEESEAVATAPQELERAIFAELARENETSPGRTRVTELQIGNTRARVVWAPLTREQQVVGALVAEALPQEQHKTLSIIANQLSLQVSRIHLYRRVEAFAITDALTGVFVRGHFLERTREELARAARHRLPCTLLMADLDFFKQKNDTYGHLVGDVVLKEVAQLLQHNLRDIDLIARYGGEEFVLLLIETRVDHAVPIAQRLKQLVEVHPIRAYDEVLTQTISIGVAGFPDHAQTLDQLIECADQALYAAKRAGRNQVIQWSEDVKREA